ncbi:MAG: hypothetical protein ABFQ95_07630 [Pseudomonadota bacterium]
MPITSGVGAELRTETFVFPEDVGSGQIVNRELTVKSSYGRGVHTADMALQVPELLEASLPNVETAIRLNHFEHGLQSYFVPNAENHQVASGTVRSFNILVVVPNGSYVPIFETKLINREKITNINVLYLNEKGISEQFSYGDCHIVYSKVGRVMTLIIFRAKDYMHEFHAVDAESADPVGQTAAQYNFGLGTGETTDNEPAEQTPPEEATVE